MYIKKLGVLLLFITLGLASSGQNLALHKSYTLSEVPNYSDGAPREDKVSLTDGVYSTTKTRFWSQRTTVGWVSKTNVKIEIDLQRIQPVGKVSLNSAGGTAGAYFPKNIYVFLSADGKNYEYVGDAAAVPNKEYGTYIVKSFNLDCIDRKARFVRIVAIPDGKLLFFDEIEVFKAVKASSLKRANLFPSDSLEDILNSFRKEEHLASDWNRTIDNFSDSFVQRLSVNREELNKVAPEKIKEIVSQRFGKFLSDSFNTPFVVEKINPWDSVGKVFLPKFNKDNIEYTFTVIKNNVHFGAFVITNSSVEDQKFSIKVISENPDIAEIKVFEVPFVPSRLGEEVPDPLVPLSEFVKVEKGLTKMFLFEVKGMNRGKTDVRISLENPKKNVNLDIGVVVVENYLLTKNDFLNGNIWPDFFNSKLIPIRDVVSRDLREHHINTIDVHPKVIPKLNSTDFQPLKDFLKSVGKFDRILLLQNYKVEEVRDGYKGGKFMSVEWRSQFKKWYEEILRVMNEAGYQPSQVYFYPYDEPRTSQDIADFRKLIYWARENVQGIQFFSTIQNQDAINEILRLVEIGQVHTNFKTSERVRPLNGEVWSYTGVTPAVSLSPYEFYRLMAWKAFADDYKGIGFWLYSISDREHLSDPLTNPDVDYSVVYLDEKRNTIYSSRRWEAFKLGIEDYSILSIYARQFGKEKARSLVDKVLMNPENTGIADSVIYDMTTELFPF